MWLHGSLVALLHLTACATECESQDETIHDLYWETDGWASLNTIPASPEVRGVQGSFESTDQDLPTDTLSD